MNKSKSHYKDPNRRSNWFKAESVPVRKLNTARKQRYQEWQDAGHTDYHALVKALEIDPKKKC